jgi:hypothetical protein
MFSNSARPALASVAGTLALLSGTAFGQVSQDLAFGVGGSARTGIANFTEVWNDAAVQADGRIIAVGSRSSRVGAGSSNFLIARLLPTGLPDTSFNGTGTIELDDLMTRRPLWCCRTARFSSPATARGTRRL